MYCRHAVTLQIAALFNAPFLTNLRLSLISPVFIWILKCRVVAIAVVMVSNMMTAVTNAVLIVNLFFMMPFSFPESAAAVNACSVDEGTSFVICSSR